MRAVRLAIVVELVLEILIAENGAGWRNDRWALELGGDSEAGRIGELLREGG